MSYQLPSDPASRTAIKKAVLEVSDSLTRISAENQFIKDVADRLKDEFDMPKPLVRKLAKIHNEQNLQEVQEKTEDLVDTFSVLFSSNQQP